MCHIQVKIIIFFLVICISYIGATVVGFPADKATDWYEEGLKATNSHEKIKCFEEAIKLNPKFIEAYYQLGSVHRANGDFEASKQSLNRALRVSPDDVSEETKIKIILELSRVYVQLEQFDFASDSYLYLKNNVIDKNTKTTVLMEFGNLYIRTEEYDQAKATFAEGLLLERNIKMFIEGLDRANHLINLKIKYSEGIDLLHQKKFEDAIIKFMEIIDKEPDYKEASVYLQLAKDSLEASIDREQPNVVTQNEVYEQNDALTNRDNEENKLMNVSISKATGIDTLYNLGLIALNNEQWNNAIEYFTSVQNIDPEYRDVNLLLINANSGLKNMKETEQIEFYYEQGIKNFKRKEWLKALIDLEKVNLLHPNYKYVDIQIEEAKRQLRLKNISSSNVAAQTDTGKPTSKPHWLLLGCIIFSAVCVPLALAVVFNPEIRARYYLMQGNYHRAAQLYEHILSKHPEKKKIYITLANIYLNDNRRDEMALRVYKGLIKEKIESPIKEKVITVVEDDQQQKNKDTLKDIIDDLKDDIEKLG